jgi:hypothetical protein
MLTILNGTQVLVYTLMHLMRSQILTKKSASKAQVYFWKQGDKVDPTTLKQVSASAISHFLNHYQCSVRAVIGVVRAEMIRQVKAERGDQRRPILTVILEMTTRRKNW